MGLRYRRLRRFRRGRRRISALRGCREKHEGRDGGTLVCFDAAKVTEVD